MADELLAALRDYIEGHSEALIERGFDLPPPAARTLGFDLTDIGPGTATVTLAVDLARHANPMGTLHGGVLCDMADFAIGSAHMTSLQVNESFTSVDLQINFFRPAFDGVLRAVAQPVRLGRTLSRYVCDVLNEDQKLVAQVTSTVMTLRGDQARGR
ncbi:MAG: PaaI family thioesterase [Pseudomonadota bacterium]